jgi:signal transduction histidine kinase
MEQTAALTTLLQVSQKLVSTLELEPLLDLILEALQGVIEHSAAAIFLLEDDHLLLSNYRGPMARADLPSVWPLAEARHAARVIEQNHPVIIANVRGDDDLACAYQRFVHAHLGPIPSYVGAWMAVPLCVKDRVIGMLSFDHNQPDSYDAADANLALAFASQTAIAIENARLYRDERIRRHQADTLLQVASVVSSTLDLDEVLDRVLDQLQQVVRYDSASVQMLQGEQLQVIAGRGFADVEQVLGRSFPMQAPFPNRYVIERNEPINLANVQEIYPVFRVPPYDHIRSWLGAPLRIQDRTVGMITLDRRDPGAFSEEEVRLVIAFADLAVMALENARLFSRAEQAAVLEERQRLARELHDSVSQALYGIALGARTARTLLDRDPARAAEPLDYVLSLAEAGLAEMRALIFELRPESLEKEGLVAAISKAAASLRARHGLVVEMDFCCDEPTLPIDQKEALYRVAQEAMNNIIKHAGASRVDLSLACNDNSLHLEIRDNGIGFDANADYPGHLGLHSMRERMAKLGGSLIIDSQPGAGAILKICVPMQGKI